MILKYHVKILLDIVAPVYSQEISNKILQIQSVLVALAKRSRSRGDEVLVLRM